MNLKYYLDLIIVQKEVINFYLCNNYWLDKKYLTKILNDLKLDIENYLWLRDLKS